MDGSSASPFQAIFDRLRGLGLEPRDHRHHRHLKRASVLILLCPRKDELHMLITLRSMNLRSHPGECCFPGGRQDEADGNDDVQTALREAHEEIGLDAELVEVLGRLPTVESLHRLCVTPIVARMQGSVPSWKLNTNEVDCAFWVPLTFFLDHAKPVVNWYERIYSYHDEESQKVFAITGLTAHLAHEVASVAYPSSINLSGTLWRRETSSPGRQLWVQRYFVLSRAHAPLMLHQYDSAEQAQRKAHTASKKNRLPLQGCSVSCEGDSVGVDGENKYEFLISALEGRIEWCLASPTAEIRSNWMRVLQTCSE